MLTLISCCHSPSVLFPPSSSLPSPSPSSHTLPDSTATLVPECFLAPLSQITPAPESSRRPFAATFIAVAWFWSIFMICYNTTRSAMSGSRKMTMILPNKNPNSLMTTAGAIRIPHPRAHPHHLRLDRARAAAKVARAAEVAAVAHHLLVLIRHARFTPHYHTTKHYFTGTTCTLSKALVPITPLSHRTSTRPHTPSKPFHHHILDPISARLWCH